MRRQIIVTTAIAICGLVITMSARVQYQQMAQAVFKFDGAEVYQSESDLSDFSDAFAVDGRFFG